ncbi:MAG: hypothetical protein ACLP05_03695 [Candidatus Kryptoniota bacterium]
MNSKLDGLLTSRCPICDSPNRDFALRCTSCGAILQQSVKTLDLFTTIYNLWRYPDFAFRKIILSEHKNYTILMAVLEAIGISYLFMFIVKAGDIYSIDLWRLVESGVGLAVSVFLPFLYVFSIVGYLATRTKQTGVSLKGFIAAAIYGLHPVAFSAIIVLPAEVSVFGAYFFSNNPSPKVINPLPFYLLSFLDIVCAVAAFIFIIKLTKVLFEKRKFVAVFAGIFFIFLYAAIEIAKKILVSH